MVTFASPPGLPTLRRSRGGRGGKAEWRRVPQGDAGDQHRGRCGVQKVTDHVAALRMQVARQVAHWTMAVSRLEDLEALASPAAWAGLERYLGVALRQNLAEAVTRLQKEAAVLRARFDAAQTADELERVRSHVVAFRSRYTRTATLVDFYGDAVNTRTNPQMASLLRACDEMAVRSMAQVLDPLGKTTPPVMTYLDIEGLGAAILKAGLRLWDGGTLSAVAAVKIAFHNLFRPTALIHEAGHQFAHITGWNENWRRPWRGALPGASREVAEVWGSWASEIAADTFAFAHTGYAAVVGLCDVLSGDEATVFQPRPGDPAPHALRPRFARHGDVHPLLRRRSVGRPGQRLDPELSAGERRQIRHGGPAAPLASDAPAGSSSCACAPRCGLSVESR